MSASVSQIVPSVSTPEISRHRRIDWGTIWGGYLPLIVVTMVMAAPLLWMLIGSIKPAQDIVSQNIQLLPKNPTLDNYRDATRQVPILRFFVNSVFLTAVGSIIKVFLAILTAYALVFVRFPRKNLIFLLILVALMVPSQVAILPNYILIAGMGGQNTYWGILLPGLGTAFGTFLLRQQFRQLPISIFEAAEMDGAGHWRRLWKMAVPVSIPSIATVALVTIVGEWNDYIWPLIITDDPEHMTLPVGLTLLQSNESDPSSYGIMMAASVLVILPILIVFSLLQRYIVAGLTQGAVAN